MQKKRSNIISVGRITGVFGVKGWVKVNSSTEPKENIVQYSPLWLKTKHGVKPVEIDEYNFRSQGLVVHIKGVDDRDLASEYTHVDIAIERAQLPELEADEFYWSQLIGLTVVSEFDGQEYHFGEVANLIETGANDVLVVKASQDSMDDRERLIPYVPEVYIKNICLESEQIRVEWDPEF